MNRFRDFDFTHPSFTGQQPALQEIYRRAYKSNMSCSEFIDAVISAKITTRGKQRHNRQYRNPHAISETYQKLDGKFNFFGRYEP